MKKKTANGDSPSRKFIAGRELIPLNKKGTSKSKMRRALSGSSVTAKGIHPSLHRRFIATVASLDIDR